MTNADPVEFFFSWLDTFITLLVYNTENIQKEKSYIQQYEKIIIFK